MLKSILPAVMNEDAGAIADCDVSNREHLVKTPEATPAKVAMTNLKPLEVRPVDQAFLDKTAHEICTHLLIGRCKPIGRLLAEVKERVSHDQWLTWLRQFGWSQSTALKVIQHHEAFVVDPKCTTKLNVDELLEAIELDRQLNQEFCGVAGVLLNNQAKLGLGPNDMLTLMNVTMGLYPIEDLFLMVRTVERALVTMSKLGLLQDETASEGIDSQTCDLPGLVSRLAELAKGDPPYERTNGQDARHTQ